MSRERRSAWHGGRALLNRKGHQSTAAIVAEIENTGAWPDDQRGTPNYTLQISNCDRSIAFDIDFYSDRERKNNLYKIDTLIKVLTDFREGLAIEQQRYAARDRAR